MEIEAIAVMRSPFGEKFGIPKQSGIVDEVESTIVFEPQYRNADYIRGLEQFSYLWIVWGFSANSHKAASPVVRPPVLGGNDKMGVFATRSPYRPNALGLSSVRIVAIDTDGPSIRVAGADLMDGTPIYDIKPYLEYADSHPGAGNGFSMAPDSSTGSGYDDEHTGLHVVIADHVRALLPDDIITPLTKLLQLDPRPRYHDDPERVYGMLYAGHNIHFRVSGGTLTIVGVSD